MTHLSQIEFVCFDCEMTGLDLEKDRLIELAAVRFTLDRTVETFHTLINPECPISPDAYAIHHISQEMVQDQPTAKEVLPSFLNFLNNTILVGHGMKYDLDMLHKSAERASIDCRLKSATSIDTLRLARDYGDSPNNSLENLAIHFNVPAEKSHRALDDVLMNIAVFKLLIRRFKTLDQILKLLSRPIKMKYMPLGKYKGRLFSEVPLQYLQWLARLDFDQDLLFSIRLELKRRKEGGGFNEASNPFSSLDDLAKS